MSETNSAAVFESFVLDLKPGRLKCTALAVSASWLVLGTASGSLFFHERASLRFEHLVSDALSGKITHLAFSPDERYLAVITADDDTCYVMEPRLRARSDVGRVVLAMTEHKAPITALAWTADALFTGDAHGVVYKTPLQLGVSQLLATRAVAEYVYQCDSEVVQLAWVGEAQLLVTSSRTRCDVIDFAAQSAHPIGKQPRNGPFGCVTRLLPDLESAPGAPTLQLLCARPLKRVWSADRSGRVLATYKFEDALRDVPATPFFGDMRDAPSDLRRATLGRLLCVGDVLVSWADDGGVLVLDVEAQRVLQWHVDAVALQCLVAVEREGTLYVLHGAADTLRITRAPFRLCARVRELIRDSGSVLRAVQLVYALPDHPEQREARALIRAALADKDDAVSGAALRALNALDAAHIALREPLPEVIQRDVLPREPQALPAEALSTPDAAGAEPRTEPEVPVTAVALPSAVHASVDAHVPAEGHAPWLAPGGPAPLELTGEFVAAVLVREGDDDSERQQSQQTSARGTRKTASAGPGKRRRAPRLVDIAPPASPASTPPPILEPHIPAITPEAAHIARDAYTLPQPQLVRSTSELQAGMLPLSASPEVRRLAQSDGSVPRSDDDSGSSSDSDLTAPAPPATAAPPETHALSDLAAHTSHVHALLATHRVHVASRALLSGAALAHSEWHRRVLVEALHAWLRAWREPTAQLVPLPPALQPLCEELFLAALELTCADDAAAVQLLQSHTALRTLALQHSEMSVAAAVAVLCERGWDAALRFLLGEVEEDAALRRALDRVLAARDVDAALVRLRARPSLPLTLRALPGLCALDATHVAQYAADLYPSLHWRLAVSRLSDAACVVYAHHLFASHPDTRREQELVHAALAAALRTLPSSQSALQEWLSAPHALALDAPLVAQWCRDAGYETGALTLALARGDVDDALRVALDSDDPALLRRVLAHTHAACLADVAWWQHVLATPPRTSAHTALLLRTALNSLGAAPTVRLIRALATSPASNTVSCDVLRALLQAARAERARANVVRSMLDVLDGYLWSQRGTSWAPQFRAVCTAESNGFADSGAASLSSGGDGNGISVDFAVDYTQPVPRSLEDAAVHWGVQSRLPASGSSTGRWATRVPSSVLARASSTPLSVHVSGVGVRDAVWALSEDASLTSRLSHE